MGLVDIYETHLPDPSNHLSFPTEALERLLAVTDLLTIKHRELGSLAATEKEGKTMGYFQAEETSVSARDRVASFQVLNITTDMIRIRADIDALENEQRVLLGWLNASRR